ncbi:glycoprotein [Kowanyama virus]|uniref:Envelopment polyprotein n=1 Tax=Kowanyama virus TaxID=1819306 RepID=A0A142J8F3_9VIRU|nr:glycoprotein [Kowanyama virus]AMR73392.1 glycoprotein [Kowanyama virus]
MKLIVLILSIACAQSLPAETRCFSNGKIIHDIWKQDGINEICIRDDISMVKSVVTFAKNDSGIFARNQIFRKIVVENWQECVPKRSKNGNINIVEILPNLAFQTEMYICDKDCVIDLDKENAQILMKTRGLNHFEISGTTIKSGWFKTTTFATLDQTCEHVKVTCGRNTIQFHSCFKQHQQCIRFLHRSILPGNIAQSICQNIELIILVVLSILVFTFLYIVSKTYICFLMIPAFIPFCLVYGFIYNKWCKQCQLCALAYHPFTKCGTHCVCGARYETSEKMRYHRNQGFCPGYKSLRLARVLCRSKGSHSLIALSTAILILMFVTPINGYSISDVDRLYNISELPDDMLSVMEDKSRLILLQILKCATDLLVMVLAGLVLILYKFWQHKFLNVYAMYCSECDMYHDRSGLKYNGDFTNKCNQCTCGEYEDAAGLFKHKIKPSCLNKYKLRWIRNILVSIIVALLSTDILAMAAAETIKTCLSKTEYNTECLPMSFAPESCDQSSKRKTIRSLISEGVKQQIIDQHDITDYTTLPDTIIGLISEIRSQETIHSQYIVEWIFLQKYCDYYSDYTKDTGYSQTAWRAFMKNHHTKYCSRSRDTLACMCLSTATGCAPSAYTFSQMKGFYNTTSEDFKYDLDLYIRYFSEIFPGSMVEILKHLMNRKETGKVKELLQSLSAKYPNNKYLNTVLLLGIAINDEAAGQNAPQYSVKKMSMSNPVDTRSTKLQPTDLLTEKITTCSEIKSLTCISPRTTKNKGAYYVCKKGTKYIPIYSANVKIHQHKLTKTDYCNLDKHCFQPFRNITSEDLEKVKKLICWPQDIQISEDEYDIGLKSCRTIDHGECNVTGDFWPAVMCDSAMIYYAEDSTEHDPAGDMGTYCFSKGCTELRYPMYVENIAACQWKELGHKDYKTLQTHYHESIETYKRAVTQTLRNNLIINKYKLTNGMPHVMPTHKLITAQGTETADGIESAYIILDIPASSGSAAGFHIRSKQGNALFDLVVSIPYAAYEAEYIKIYTTGHTIGINSRHNETCTGRCPGPLNAPDGWVSYSKERTSQWGCEEWGCMAINEGCLYGFCQDIIKDEMAVFKKTGVDRQKIQVCVLLAHESYCTMLSALEATVSGNLDIQFLTTEVSSLPVLLGVKHHMAYTGQLNDIGSFTKGCGNVQKIKNITYGAGVPKVDYTCHLAARKDIVIRKCYDNNYASCKFLKPESGLILQESPENILVKDTRKILGSMKLKIDLGDINYKLFVKDVDFIGSVRCVGCVGCMRGLDCEINVDIEMMTSCEVQTECSSSSHNIMVFPKKRVYAVRLNCKTGSEPKKIKICGKEIHVDLTEIGQEEKIEINNGDETAYIVEEDKRCGTWLCKVREEGITAFFEPLTRFFGSIWSIILLVIIIIVMLFIVAYCLLPICCKIKDELRRNEQLALLEAKIK